MPRFSLDKLKSQIAYKYTIPTLFLRYKHSNWNKKYRKKIKLLTFYLIVLFCTFYSTLSPNFIWGIRRLILSVIRQKDESENGVSRKQSKLNFQKNEHFLPADKGTYVCVSGSKKCLFFGKFGVLCFLETPFWDSSFCLITNDLGPCQWSMVDLFGKRVKRF